MTSATIRRSLASASVLLATLLLAVGCGQPFSTSGSNTEIEVPLSGGASLSLTFSVPDYRELLAGADGSHSRAIAPQTAAAGLLVRNEEHSQIAGTVGTDTWTGTFAGVPAGTYAAGELTVELRAGDGTPLTRGSNASAVTVSEGATTAVSISCVPATESTAALTHFTSSAGAVPANAMRYYSFAATAGARQKVWIQDASAEGLFMIFDPDGAIVTSETFYPDYWRQAQFTAAQTGTYYLGVYGDYAYGGSQTTFTVMSTDNTPRVAVLYEARPVGGSSSTHEIRPDATTDLGQFDQGYPESWNDSLQFEILNLGGDGSVRLTSFNFTPGDAPLTLLEAPPLSAEFGWGESFVLDLDQSTLTGDPKTSTLSFEYELLDDGGATISSGHTFSATLQVETVAPRPQMEVRVYYPERSTTEPIENGGTWDLGELIRNSGDSWFFRMRNEGNGDLEVSSVVFADDASGQISFSDGGARTTSTGNDDYRSFWIDAADAPGGPFTVPVTIHSNDATSPFTFTLEFDVVDYYGSPQATFRDGLTDQALADGGSVDLGPFFTGAGTTGWSLYVSNTGTNELNVASASFSGGQGALSVDPEDGLPPGPIAPGNDDRVTIMFSTDMTAGSHTETLTVTADDPIGTHAIGYAYSLVEPGDIVVNLRRAIWNARTLPSDDAFVYDLSRTIEAPWVGRTERYYLEVRNTTATGITLAEKATGEYLSLSGDAGFTYAEMRDENWALVTDGGIPAGESVFIGVDLAAASERWYETTAVLTSGGGDYTLNLKLYADDVDTGVTGTITHAANSGATAADVEFYLDSDTDPTNGRYRSNRFTMLGDTVDYTVARWDGTYYAYAWEDVNRNGIVDAGDYYGEAGPFTIVDNTVTPGINITMEERL